jgi:hypothetical protein
MRRGFPLDGVDRDRVALAAAADLVQLLIFLLVAHFQPFLRGRITTPYAAYQQSEKALGKGRERLFPGMQASRLASVGPFIWV